MKKLIFLMLFASVAFAQNHPRNDDANEAGFLRDYDSGDGTYVVIHDRSYSGGVTDTTDFLNAADHKTLYVALTTKDSATILIDYSVSVDSETWSDYTVKDSLSYSGSTNGFKSVDFSSTVLGFQYVRFRFRTSANAFALGTTTPTYSAIYLFKKE